MYEPGLRLSPKTFNIVKVAFSLFGHLGFIHRYTGRLFLVDLGWASKVTLVEGVGGRWVIPPFVPKNIYRDAK